jgi:hypothetical protein
VVPPPLNEHELRPAYRAEGRRQDRVIWAVGARTIDVRRVDCDGERTLKIDGFPRRWSFPRCGGKAITRSTEAASTTTSGRSR